MFSLYLRHCPLRTRCWLLLLKKVTRRHLRQMPPVKPAIVCGCFASCSCSDALAFSPQSFDEDRAAAAFSGIRTPSNHMPGAKAELLRLLETQVRELCQHDDDSDVVITGDDFQELLKSHQMAYDGA